MRATPGIVIACDVETLERLQGLVAATATSPAVAGYKLGFSLALRHGLPECVRVIRSTNTGKFVLYDHQKAGTDIPQTADLFARICADAGVDGAILFPQAGPATLAAWVRALQEREVLPVVGALMTHGNYLVSEGGFLENGSPQRVYTLALEAGVRDFVLPATKPQTARQLRALMSASQIEEISVFTPGLGRQGADATAAREEFGSFRWFPIVGSAIYDAADPASEAAAFGRQLALT
jgi:orotidine-5'-phosphate decarboxylase